MLIRSLPDPVRVLLIRSHPGFVNALLAVLLYGAETWKMTEHGALPVEQIQERMLEKHFSIFWPEKITNKDL